MKALATLLLLLPLPVAAQTVTKAEFRSQNPRVTEREMKDQILGIFEPVNELRRTDNPEPTRPLDSVFLTGRSYATDMPGLCRSDTAIIRFAPVGVGVATRDADTPVRAYGIESSARFHFVRPPTGWYNDKVDYERSPWDRECHGLDPDKTDYFMADDDEMATDAVYAFSLAGVAVAAGKVTPTCDMAPVDKRVCAKVVADMTAQTIWWIRGCDAETSRKCFELTGGDDVVMTVGVSKDGVVDRVKMDQAIILTHTRID